MLGVVVVAVLMAICGSTLLQEWLNPREHALRFILLWLACAWFTATALLLALFDLLMVRTQGRSAGKALREQLGTERDNTQR